MPIFFNSTTAPYQLYELILLISYSIFIIIYNENNHFNIRPIDILYCNVCVFMFLPFDICRFGIASVGSYENERLENNSQNGVF